MTDHIIDALRELARFLFVVLIWQLVLFNLGRGSLLLCTLGRYPRGLALKRDTDRIALAGLGVLICAWSAIAIYNNFVSPTTPIN